MNSNAPATKVSIIVATFLLAKVSRVDMVRFWVRSTHPIQRTLSKCCPKFDTQSMAKKAWNRLEAGIDEADYATMTHWGYAREYDSVHDVHWESSPIKHTSRVTYHFSAKTKISAQDMTRARAKIDAFLAQKAKGIMCAGWLHERLGSKVPVK